MTGREFEERLAPAIRQANLTVPVSLIRSLETYFQLLAKWNRTINLSGMPLDDPSPEAIERLLIEPLLAAREVGQVARMIDIGSGGGSPAIPMALTLNPTELVMVESKTRKTVFLAEAARSVQLASARVVTARYETILSEADFAGRFDLLTVRAVRVSPIILGLLQLFLRPGGLLMVFTRRAAEPLDRAGSASLRYVRAHNLSELLQSRIVIFENSPGPS